MSVNENVIECYLYLTTRLLNIDICLFTDVLCDFLLSLHSCLLMSQKSTFHGYTLILSFDH